MTRTLDQKYATWSVFWDNESCPEDELVWCTECGKEFCPEHYEKHYEDCLDTFLEQEDDYYVA